MFAKSLLGICLLLGTVPDGRASIVADAAELQQLHDRFKGELVERVATMRAYFEANLVPVLSPDTLRTLPEADIRAVFAASRLMAFYDLSPERLQEQRVAFAALRVHDWVGSDEVKSMFGTLIAHRQFDEARKLADDFPNVALETVPELRDAEGFDPAKPAVLRVAEVGAPWFRENPPMSNDVQIVVVSHPLCHFSQEATAAIEADPELARAFVAHSLWIGPDDRRLSRDEYLEWRVQHPRFPISPILSEASWPMLDTSSTPQFYFLRDGVVQARVIGWPKEGNRDAVLAALKRIGL